MRKIDDKFDAVRTQYPETPDNVPGELALRIGGSIFPIIGFLNTVRDYYSQRAINERMRVLVDAVNDKVNATGAAVDAVKTQANQLDDKIKSPEFAEGIRIAIDETLRTTDLEKVNRFAAILGGSFLSVDLDAPRDAVEFIRTVAQLGDQDIRALNILYIVNADTMKKYSNLHDPNPFTARKTEVIQRVNDAKIHHDDFYSSCNRLVGFGLAMELPRNPSSMAPGEYCFRPTRRGEKLFYLLEGSRRTT